MPFWTSDRLIGPHAPVAQTFPLLSNLFLPRSACLKGSEHCRSLGREAAEIGWAPLCRSVQSSVSARDLLALLSLFLILVPAQ